MRTKALGAGLALASAVLAGLWLATPAERRGDIDDLLDLRPESLPAATPAAELLPGLRAQLAQTPRSANRFFMVAVLESRRVSETGDEGAIPEVEALLRRALELRDDYLEAEVALARSLNQQHRFGVGAEIAGAVVAAAPGAASARAVLFDAYFGLGEYAAAAAALDAFDAATASPALLARQAQLAELHGEDELAGGLLRQAARRARDRYQSRSDVAWYLYRLGAFARARGRDGRAVQLVEAALRLAPDFLPARLERAELLAAGTDPRVAIAAWEEITATLPHPELLARLGDLYLAAGHDEDAWAAYRAALRAGAAAGAAEDRPVAQLLADRGWRPAEALFRARRDLSHRQDVEAWDTLAWAAYRAGALEEAAAASAEALRHGTRRADFHVHAALIHAATGDEAQARMHRDAARAIDPGVELRAEPVMAPEDVREDPAESVTG